MIKTSNLIWWSLQIARGMEFLASKKVVDAFLIFLKCERKCFLISDLFLGFARRFGGSQCPCSRLWNRQSGRFWNGEANEGLRI
jgi:hypothetical protein